MSDTSAQPAGEQPRKEISAEEFIKIWKGDYKRVKGYEEFYQERYDKEVVVFEGYQVIGDIVIKKQKELLDIELRNTETDFFCIENSATGDFYIENSKSDCFDIVNHSTTGNFRIINSTTSNFYIKNSTSGEYDICNNSTTGNFCIINSKTGDFYIENSTSGNYEIRDNSTFGYLEIGNNSTLDDFYMHNSTMDKYDIRNNSTTGFCYIENSTLDDFYIENSMMDYFYMNNSVIKSIEVSKASIESITIKSSVYIGRLILNYLNEFCKTLTIKSSTIDSLALQLDKTYKVRIKGEEGRYAQIGKIDFKDTIITKDAYIHISDTDVNQMNIDSFLNQGAIVLNNISAIEEVKQLFRDKEGKVGRNQEGEQKGKYEFEQINKPSKISIINSDLGNTQFIGCDLASFKSFEFKNSKMAGLFLADTKIPKRKKIVTVPPFTRVQQLAQQRLALSQFKKVYESRGDIVKATELRAQELEAHSRYLVRTGFFSNIVELFNLWLNKISGNYGNNWLWAASAALIVNWLFFWWYSSEVGYVIGDIHNEEHRVVFWKLFSYSFEFLNPIRKHSTLTDESFITPTARIIDYIGRIFIAYFVYQTIAAFRKFGRKSA